MGIRNKGRTTTTSTREYGRKSYKGSPKQSYRGLFKAVTNYAMYERIVEPHSEFIKPYLTGGNYQAMEHFYPPPTTKFNQYGWNSYGNMSFNGFNYPNLAGPEFSGSFPDDTKLGWIGWYITGCSMDCPILIRGDACGTEICCTLTAFQPVSGAFVQGGDGVALTNYDAFKVCFKVAAETSQTSVVVGVATRPKSRTHTKSGSCTQTIGIDCFDLCANPTALTIDTGTTGETIAPGGTSTVAVLGGVGPYTWSDPGTGYSWDNATTDGLSNTLNAVAEGGG
ncbi:hypothetical protein LCGC14_1209020 [marine sediment metagenome]|uniref:Uncharacterized protein n=1 Tax=marine sediment metagenome TaxID=412755 RepID=A0A0F9LEL7_9ZZZZ